MNVLKALDESSMPEPEKTVMKWLFSLLAFLAAALFWRRPEQAPDPRVVAYCHRVEVEAAATRLLDAALEVARHATTVHGVLVVTQGTITTLLWHAEQYREVMVRWESQGYIMRANPKNDFERAAARVLGAARDGETMKMVEAVLEFGDIVKLVAI